MQTFRVVLGPVSHPVHVGDAILDGLGELSRAAGIKPGPVALVTDSNVAPHYSARAASALEKAGFVAKLMVVPAGEASKSSAVLQDLYDHMIRAEIDRSSSIFALGGGVVGDLGGFAAASYLRGIAVVQVPTTLVAQVDSSLGGKTGVNHPRAKNLIGAFHQPSAIIADVGTLITLPEREFREGLAEAIKYGAIMDAAMLTDLERDLDHILARDLGILEALVARSLRLKAALVTADEREAGLRKILNFGHTIGHALEASAGYGTYLHGEAVAIGMAAAATLSEKLGGLSADEGSRLVRLLQRAGLPTEMPPKFRTPDFAAALRLDKKRLQSGVEFVLLQRLGKAAIKRLDFDQIVAVFTN
jgi:3-dehydroquinate synthase